MSSGTPSLCELLPSPRPLSEGEKQDRWRLHGPRTSFLRLPMSNSQGLTVPASRRLWWAVSPTH